MYNVQVTGLKINDSCCKIYNPAETRRGVSVQRPNPGNNIVGTGRDLSSGSIGAPALQYMHNVTVLKS